MLLCNNVHHQKSHTKNGIEWNDKHNKHNAEQQLWFNSSTLSATTIILQSWAKIGDSDLTFNNQVKLHNYSKK